MENSLPPSEKVKTFPASPGVYIMKDVKGVVLYIGKAKNLRSRASHYFTKAAAEDPRTQNLVPLIEEIEFLQAETEVDALLLEARLIKDIQPRFNAALKDGRTFPYLQIRVREEFPRVEFTRSPRRQGVRLYGPFTNSKALKHAILILQRVFKFRTCGLDIKSDENRWRWFRPCLLHSIRQCTAPCNLRVTREEYRAQIKSLIHVLEGRKKKLIRKMRKEMQDASKELLFEKAARIRDEILSLEKLEDRGDKNRDVQPGAFPIDPKKGLTGLRKILGLATTPRTIEGIDIAHLGGTETVASLVRFLDGLPFKQGYRKFRIKSVQGIDDYASIREVVFRRFKKQRDSEEIFPDVILIDGGKGQLNAALDAFKLLGIEPPCLISLAKKDEEIFRLGDSEPIRLGRHSSALRLLQYVRDEAHRFAQHYHHVLRHKKLENDLESALETEPEPKDNANPAH